MSLPHQLIALLVTFIWGSNFVLIKIGLAEFPPFLFVFLRFLLVVLPLVFFLPRPKAPWRVIASYGILIGFGQFGLMVWAMQDNISPGLASLVIQTQVFFTIVLAAVFIKEKIQARQTLGLGIAAVGLLLIAIQTSQQTNIQTTGLGLGVVLVAAASWAGGNLLVKHVGKVDIVAFLAWSSIFALPPLLLMSLYLEGPNQIMESLSSATMSAWAILIWQAIGNTLIGYGLWNMLLLNYAASKIAPWALMVPVFGIAASALILHEPLPWWKLLASGLILFGLMVNVMATPKKS